MIKSIQAKALTLFVVLVVVFSTAIFVYKNSNPAVLGAQESQTKKIKIGCTKTTVCLSTFAAIEKGYFKAQNIDVEYVNFESPAALTDAIIARNIDISGGSSISVVAAAYSKDPNVLKIFSPAYFDNDHPAYILAVKNDQNINSISDLKGKTVGVAPGPQSKLFFKLIADNAGLTTSEVGGSGDIFYREIGFSDQIQAFQSGQIQAISSPDPVGAQIEALGIGKKLGVSPVSDATGFPVWLSPRMINQKFAKENPETTQKVIQAFDKAIDDIQKDPDDQRQYLEKYTGIKEPVLSKVALPGYKKSSELSNEDMEDTQKLLKIFQDQGMLKSEVNVKDMIYKP